MSVGLANHTCTLAVDHGCPVKASPRDSQATCQLRLDFDEFNIAAPFTCGGSGSSVQCGTADGPLIGDCIYDAMTVTTPGTAQALVLV